jgi:hypothetical protein
LRDLIALLLIPVPAAFFPLEDLGKQIDGGVATILTIEVYAVALTRNVNQPRFALRFWMLGSHRLHSKANQVEYPKILGENIA